MVSGRQEHHSARDGVLSCILLCAITAPKGPLLPMCSFVTNAVFASLEDLVTHAAGISLLDSGARRDGEHDRLNCAGRHCGFGGEARSVMSVDTCVSKDRISPAMKRGGELKASIAQVLAFWTAGKYASVGPSFKTAGSPDQGARPTRNLERESCGLCGSLHFC